MRYIHLEESEKIRLIHLSKTSPNFVVRDRSSYLLFSSRGFSIAQIALFVDVSRYTIARLFDSWESASGENKFDTLSISSGRGAKNKLESIKHLIAAMVEKHNRNLNPVLEQIEQEHGIKICKLTLQIFLKGSRL